MLIFGLSARLTRYLLYMEKAAQHAVLLRCNMHACLQEGIENIGPIIIRNPSDDSNDRR